jgi:hypothetical protein
MYWPKDDMNGIHVDIDLIPISLSEVDIIRSTLKVSAYLILEWYDGRLKWNPSDYENNITEVIINPTKLWIPDVSLVKYYEISTDSNDKSKGVHVCSNGKV